MYSNTDLLIDTLQMPDIMGSAEALVYCIGALKFLSSNDAIARHLVKKDLIEKLARLLSTVNKIVSVFLLYVFVILNCYIYVPHAFLI